MSDLISKRAVLAKINLWVNGGCDTDKLIESIKKMSGGSLTDRPCEYCKNHVDGRCAAWDCAFDDVLSSSENPNKSEIMTGWIPVSERLPEDAYGCIVTVMDVDLKTQNEFENILPYFVGYDGETWNNADGEPIPYEVIAWMKAPEPYKAEGSNT